MQIQAAVRSTSSLRSYYPELAFSRRLGTEYGWARLAFGREIHNNRWGSADTRVEQREVFVCCWECSLGRHSEKHWRASCTFPRKMKTCCLPQICSHVFIDILVTSGLNCNNVSGLSNGRWRIKESKNQSIVQSCKWMLFGLKRD